MALGVGVVDGVSGVLVAWGSGGEGEATGEILAATLALGLALGVVGEFVAGPQPINNQLESPRADKYSVFFMAISFQTRIESI